MRSLFKLLVRLARCSSGSALVEMTVVVPVAISLMAGAVDFGMAVFLAGDSRQIGTRCSTISGRLPAALIAPSTGATSICKQFGLRELHPVRCSPLWTALIKCQIISLLNAVTNLLKVSAALTIALLFLRGHSGVTCRHFQAHSPCPPSTRRFKLASKLLRDITGSILVEYTIVFPLFILLVLGTIDVTYMLYEWALANKAAYVGARTAVVSDPVANGITNLTLRLRADRPALF